MIQDGVYSDVIGIYGYERNVLVVPRRSLVVISAENRGAATIRCLASGTDESPRHPFATRDMNTFDVETHGAIQLDGVNVQDCDPARQWEEYDSKRRPWNTTVSKTRWYV